MPDTIKTVIVIPVLALFCGALVFGAYSRFGTKPESATQALILQEIKRTAGANAVVIETENDRVTTGRFWRIETGGTLIMAAFIITSYGFHGPVNALATVDTTGKLIDILILSHHEHPALTGKSRAETEGLAFLKGIMAKPAQCSPDQRLSAVSGATVTRKALGPDIQTAAAAALKIAIGRTPGDNSTNRL